MHVHGLGRAVPMGVPDLCEDLSSADHRTRVESEQRKHVEFLRRERYLLAGKQDAVRAPVDLELADELGSRHRGWR